jgi:hypothetical protein
MRWPWLREEIASHEIQNLTTVRHEPHEQEY